MTKAILTSLIVCMFTVVNGCVSVSEPELVSVVIRISSNPSGALVMMCPGRVFVPEKAVTLGETPVLRRLDLPATGSLVQVTKAGFREWSGVLSGESPNIAATLVPFTDSERSQLGWVESGVCDRLTVVPVRVGIRKTGSDSDDLDTSAEAEEFRRRFRNTFEPILADRFGTRAMVTRPPMLTGGEAWEALSGGLEGIRFDQIGYYPVPKRLQLGAAMDSELHALGGAVLFVRVEACYLGSGARTARFAAPLVKTAISDMIGSANPVYTGSDYFAYVYTIHGPSDARDTILVDMCLTHSQTSEILWLGRVLLPDWFKRKGVVEDVARRAAAQIPSRFFTASPAAGASL